MQANVLGLAFVQRHNDSAGDWVAIIIGLFDRTRFWELHLNTLCNICNNSISCAFTFMLRAYWFACYSVLVLLSQQIGPQSLYG